MTSKVLTLVAMITALAVCNAEVSAQGPGGPHARGGRPSFDRLLQAFDADDSESLSEDEVPGRVWSRLSQADADGDREVTREEFDGYKPGRGGRRGSAPAGGFGPPAEVIEAWMNGQGFDLPGPPWRR